MEKLKRLQNSTGETKNGTKVRSCMRMWMIKLTKAPKRQTDPFPKTRREANRVSQRSKCRKIKTVQRASWRCIHKLCPFRKDFAVISHVQVSSHCSFPIISVLTNAVCIQPTRVSGCDSVTTPKCVSRGPSQRCKALKRHTCGLGP